MPGSRVLTKLEYDTVYAPEGTYVQTLKDIYRSNQFLFLGCSLDSDKTLDVFSSCMPLYRDHYAFLRVKLDDGSVKSAEESVKDHEARLRKMGIKVIWYTGEHARALQHLMISMLAAKGII